MFKIKYVIHLIKHDKIKLKTQKQSKRYIPEVMNFIVKSLLMIIPESYITEKTKTSLLNSKIIVNNEKFKLIGKDWKKTELQALNLALVMSNNTTKKENAKYNKSNELR